MSDLMHMIKVWMAQHHLQFIVLTAIGACLFLVLAISIVLLKTRPKRVKEIPNLTEIRNRKAGRE